MARLWSDFDYALRSLRRSPAFTMVAVASLALGIGANTAIFQLLDAVRLRSLPVPSPQEIAEVRIDDMTHARGSWMRDNALTNRLWEEIRRRQQIFSEIFAWADGEFNIAQGPEARPARGLWVSGNLLDALGVRPALGRVFHADDDRRGCRVHRRGDQLRILAERIRWKRVDPRPENPAQPGLGRGNRSRAAGLLRARSGQAVRLRTANLRDRDWEGPRLSRFRHRVVADRDGTLETSRFARAGRRAASGDLARHFRDDIAARLSADQRETLPVDEAPRDPGWWRASAPARSILGRAFFVARHRCIGPVDRVREPGEPDARESERAGTRDRGAPGHRRIAEGSHPAVEWSKDS